MPDLIEAYFQRDLSEAEEDALQALIADDVEQSTRLGMAAQQRHKKMVRAKWRNRILVLLVAAGLGFALFGTIGNIDIEVSPPVIGSSPPPIVPIKIERAKSTAPAAAPRKKAKATSAPAPVERRKETKVVSPPLVDPVPVNSDQIWATTLPGGEGLRVILKTVRAGDSVISVHDRGGTMIRELYRGPLNAGQWKFDWDGTRSDGFTAAAGAYEIRLLHAGERSRKWVELEMGIKP